MAATVVDLGAHDDDREAVVEILENALEQARSGVVRDVAVILAVRDDDGPQFQIRYYGEAAYSTILAGTSALEFDLHYRRYVPEED
jgi:hypothetical protein